MRKLTSSELRARKPDPDALNAGSRQPLYVVVNNVRSLFNVGSLFRLADAVGVERLYLTGFTGYPDLGPRDSRPPYVRERAQRGIEKTAIHTLRYVAWDYREDAAELVRELRQRGVQVVALEQTTHSVPYLDADYRFPLCILLGHERAGVDDELLALADLAVEIPLLGLGTSLNVATAFGILAYELVRRQRDGHASG